MADGLGANVPLFVCHLYREQRFLRPPVLCFQAALRVPEPAVREEGGSSPRVPLPDMIRTTTLNDDVAQSVLAR